MPLPIIAGGITSGAAVTIGAALAAAIAGSAVDSLLDYGLSNLDPNGDPVVAPPPAQITNNVTVTNNVSANPDVVNDLTIEDEIGGTPRARVGIVRRQALTPELENSAAATINRVAQTPQGRSGLRQMASAVRSNHPTTTNTAGIRSARPEIQAAARHMARRPLPVPVDEDLERELRRSSRADGSRTSLEYHEWKFNVVATGKNWELLSNNQWHEGTSKLSYNGSDPVLPFYGPPYYIWVQYENLRKLINLVKRYNRLRSSSGGKRLWIAQGFATRTEAVVDDLANDSEAQAIGTALGATSDFDLEV